MRKVNVPVDMSSEQKVILGIVSMRQLIYIAIGGSVIYAFVPFTWNLLAGFPLMFKLVACILPALPVVVVVAPLAFIRKKNYHMFYDFYLLIRFNAKNQHGVWRNGTTSKKWMEEL